MSARPSHRHRPSGALVFPRGYRRRDLEPLPAGFWLGEDRAQLAGAIKAEAARRIEAIAPAWRQMNDLREPSPEGAARFAAIDEVRTWSNALEARALAATDEAELAAVRDELSNEETI